MSFTSTSNGSCGGSSPFAILYNLTGADMWIYSRSLRSFGSSRCTSESKKYSRPAKKETNSNSNSNISAFKHWILVAKFQGLTLWMEAFKKNGVLKAHFLESEPNDIEEKCFLGNVKNLSMMKMINLVTESKLVGEKYSLTGANCQTWIKGILKELGFEGDFNKINDVMVDFSVSAAACTAVFGFAVIAGAPVVVAAGLCSLSSSSSASLIAANAKNENSSDFSKPKKS